MQTSMSERLFKSAGWVDEDNLIEQLMQGPVQETLNITMNGCSQSSLCVRRSSTIFGATL